MPKTVTFLVHVLTEPVAGECPACLFDALRRAHGYRLSVHGVTQVFDRIYCGRCAADRRRER